jgi:septum site-determining protein MinC
MQALSRDGAVEESAVSAATRARAAFELKGLTSSLTVMRLRSRDLNLIERQLRAKVTQFRQFFEGAPLVLDVGGLEGGLEGFPLAALVRALRVSKVVPVAVTNVEDAHKEMVLAAGLGILSSDRDARRAPAPSANPEGPGCDERASESPVPDAAPPTKTAGPTARTQGSGLHRLPVVVRQPVRSGQVIYAEKTDLIVLAPVNPGAQLVADGNIHVYAPLRGRALAGAQGYAEARIFCQRLEAELIAIAGAYVTFDDIPADRRSKPVQVCLQDGRCLIAPL